VNVTPEELTAIKEALPLAQSRLRCMLGVDRGNLATMGAHWIAEDIKPVVDAVPALVAEVERARRLLLWLSSAYLDALTSLRDEGCEPTQWGTHREMERIATTIAESAPRGEPFTPEQQKELEAWAAEVTL
jgi:hypothetical protein